MSERAIEIRVAATPGDYDRFGVMIREYWEWLRERYASIPGLMESIGSHQGLEHELATLAETYGPPEGRTLLAFQGDEVAGCVAYHRLADGSCEMKRMYVPAPFQGHGLGRRLASAILELAAADGYAMMRLDTGFMNVEAMAMYEKLGFEYTEAYAEYPKGIAENLRFMAAPLAAG